MSHRSPLARRSLGLAASLLLAAACIGGIAGSGDLVTEQRSISEFDRIAVSDGIDLRLSVIPGHEAMVDVTYDDNLVDRVQTEVEGGTLVVRVSGSLSVVGDGERFVEVMVPDLAGLEASGGARVSGQGTAASLDLTASGGADVDLSSLQVATMTLGASGGASVTVFVTDSIEGDASGGADVVVGGAPPLQSVETSGGAQVSNG